MTRPSSSAVVGEVLAPSVGQALGAAVAGGVDRDDLEAHRHEPRERLGVEEALGREAVHDHERDAPAATAMPTCARRTSAIWCRARRGAMTASPASSSAGALDRFDDVAHARHLSADRDRSTSRRHGDDRGAIRRAFTFRIGSMCLSDA